MNKIEQSTDPSTLNFDGVRSREALPIIRRERRVACPRSGEKHISPRGVTSVRSKRRPNQQRRDRSQNLRTALSP